MKHGANFSRFCSPIWGKRNRRLSARNILSWKPISGFCLMRSAISPRRSGNRNCSKSLNLPSSTTVKKSGNKELLKNNLYIFVFPAVLFAGFVRYITRYAPHKFNKNPSLDSAKACKLYFPTIPKIFFLFSLFFFLSLSGAEKIPERVVVCYPSLLELWLECGGRVVGVHTPAPGEQLPSGAEQAVPVGRFFHPSPEKIIQLEPDLVILNALARGNPMLANLLKRSGIRVLLLSYENYSDYRKIAALFRRLQGKKNAPDSVATVERDVKTIMDRCAGRRNPPRFLVFFFNGANFRAETSLAHTAYIAEALGGINALAPGQRPVSAHRVSFSREKLLLEDPDLILIVPATKNKKSRTKRTIICKRFKLIKPNLNKN